MWKIYLTGAGLFITILGGGVGYGQLQKQVKVTEEVVKENKAEIKENQKINVEQTVVLAELGITLRGVSKALDKVVEKLDN